MLSYVCMDISLFQLVLIRVRNILMLCVGFILLLPTVVVYADADTYDGRLWSDEFMC